MLKLSQRTANILVLGAIRAMAVSLGAHLEYDPAHRGVRASLIAPL